MLRTCMPRDFWFLILICKITSALRTDLKVEGLPNFIYRGARGQGPGCGIASYVPVREKVAEKSRNQLACNFAGGSTVISHSTLGGLLQAAHANLILAGARAAAFTVFLGRKIKF